MSTDGTQLKDFLVMETDDSKIDLSNQGIDKIIEKGDEELTNEERMLLYEKGKSFLHLGSHNHALLCFLGCVKGLDASSKSHFTVLPQCLTHISKIYAAAGDYERAVEFMQATKLYYETAIIEVGVKVDEYKKETDASETYKPLDLDPCLDDARRANEYERLSNSCLEQKKFQLALEYCGKATQLRQQVYGNEHPLTVKSLDMFTLIYAEMGRSQYSEAMDKCGDLSEMLEDQKKKQDELLQKEQQINQTNQTEEEKENIDKLENVDKDDTIEEEKEPLLESSLKRQDDLSPRSSSEKKVKFSPCVEMHEIPANKNNNAAKQRRDNKNNISVGSMLIFFILSVVLAVLFTAVWCRFSQSPVCPSTQYFFGNLFARSSR